MPRSNLIPTILTKVGMISKPRNETIRMEVVPLSIHVIDLFIKYRLHSILSIWMVTLAEVTAQD